MARMRYYEIEALTPTFESHRRILEDSVNIVRKTNNLKTLLSRYEDILDSYNWITLAIDAGYPAKFEAEAEGFESSVNRWTNTNIERIANYRYDVEMRKIHDLKTKISKRNRTEKLIKELNEMIDSLKPHSNRQEVKSNILNIVERINQFKNIVL
ncbi:MAG: hypothetical protein ACOX19_05775 [Fermentimonas sp.]|jgi:hypothetical protein